MHHSLNVISSLEPENEEDDNQENEQHLYNDSGTLRNAYCNNEVEDSSTSYQHRKAVELIECNKNGDATQRERKPAPSFLGAHNGKNRRRKRLRKT